MHFLLRNGGFLLGNGGFFIKKMCIVLGNGVFVKKWVCFVIFLLVKNLNFRHFCCLIFISIFAPRTYRDLFSPQNRFRGLWSFRGCRGNIPAFFAIFISKLHIKNFKKNELMGVYCHAATATATARCPN
jgi:hypothetical protein